MFFNAKESFYTANPMYVNREKFSEEQYLGPVSLVQMAHQSSRVLIVARLGELEL